MINCIFYAIFFSLFLSVSFGSFRLSQVNRTFLSSYKGIFEASVITVNNKGEPIYPYYEQNILTNYVNEFIGKSVEKFVTSYTLNINFYQLDGVTECGVDDLARSVKINLNAKINYLFTYDKTQNFSIKEKGNL